MKTSSTIVIVVFADGTQRVLAGEILTWTEQQAAFAACLYGHEDSRPVAGIICHRTNVSHFAAHEVVSIAQIARRNTPGLIERLSVEDPKPIRRGGH